MIRKTHRLVLAGLCCCVLQTCLAAPSGPRPQITAPGREDEFIIYGPAFEPIPLVPDATEPIDPVNASSETYMAFRFDDPRARATEADIQTSASEGEQTLNVRAAAFRAPEVEVQVSPSAAAPADAKNYTVRVEQTFGNHFIVYVTSPSKKKKVNLTVWWTAKDQDGKPHSFRGEIKNASLKEKPQQ